ncbi:hypothetical protein BDW74DRAFT_41063 [Aspergillus multicolor]|uniref:NTF2 and RRM domain protein n=1 Tax=Aspergillus multicolor TaxID=41759 RepID=UPI003CCD2965
MADTQIPINGTYQTQPAYPDSYNHAHTAVNSVSNFQPAQSSTPSNAPSNDQKNGISKDEVGWYFVEQYYTNMSRSPDKLHLFYSRRSQLVFGTEAESVPVAVGQKAIQDKIKQLDFQDCKVRVLNVDAQASFENILISVIGEISNKQEPSRKFVQTFVLAEQPNGYYVLNDVFRYLADEEVTEDAAVSSDAAEEPELQTPAQTVAEPSTETEESKVDSEEAVAKVDEKLETAEEAQQEAPAAEPAPQTNGTEQPEAAPEPAEAPVEAPAPVTEAEPEKSISPEPTPALAVEKEAPAKEAAPPAKAVPKTWASIASKVGAAAPVVPAIPVAPVKPAPAAATAPQPAAAAPAAAPAVTPAAESVPSQPSSTDGSGWQTAGHDHKKSQARAGDNQTVLGYIKNVTEKVNADLLKETLERFGKLTHFDVSRQKNCAFIEFADRAGYNAAVAANPHQIGTEQVKVEERRPRGNVYGGNANYGPGRGGAGRGRGDRAGSQGRGGFQREGRGGFAPRGRGGNANPKPRNQGQAA